MDRNPLKTSDWMPNAEKSRAVPQISGNVGNAGKDSLFLASLLRFRLPNAFPIDSRGR